MTQTSPSTTLYDFHVAIDRYDGSEEHFAALIHEAGEIFSLARLATEFKVHQDVVERWIIGDSVPPDAARDRILRDIQSLQFFFERRDGAYLHG